MVHYHWGTFHCYILGCVVSSDKRTTILISIRRKNTWLEPMKSALSFCHWLRPSGANKVFPFESTAVGNYTGTLLLSLSFFCLLSWLCFENRPCFCCYCFFGFFCEIWSQKKKGEMAFLKRTCFTSLPLSLCLPLTRSTSPLLHLSPRSTCLPSLCWWLKGWPRQSICQRLTVLQHMHYTDGYHHSHNDCPPPWNLKTTQRAVGSKRIEESDVKAFE